MYQTCKPVIKSWVKRAAFHAIDHLQDAWGEQLTWPLAILCPSPPLDPSLYPAMDMSQMPLNELEGFDPNLPHIPTTDFDMASLSAFMGSEGGHTTSA
jgi:hypothetical protein